MQANPSPAPSDDASTQAIRLKLIAGFSTAITEKGYAATTIADVVRAARVSKRTFYEHFSDKEACFLASYGLASDETLRAIAAAADPSLPWEDRVHAATGAYLAALDRQPALTRTYLLEIHAAGPRALELRREVHGRFAELLRRLVTQARKERPELRALSPAMATAIVGGINELVLVALEKGGPARLRDVASTVADLVRSVLTAPA